MLYGADRHSKQADDSIQMQFPTSPDTVVPHLDPAKDTGPWVKALLKLPPGSTLMAASEWLTWPQWIAIFGEVTGAKTSYKQTSKDDLGKHIPGEVGKEIGDMFEFSSDFAYNAFQLDTFKTWDLEKVSHRYPNLAAMVNVCARWESRCQQQHCAHTSSKRTGCLREFFQHGRCRGLAVKRMETLMSNVSQSGEALKTKWVS